jgi:hypothetical protein
LSHGTADFHPPGVAGEAAAAYETATPGVFAEFLAKELGLGTSDDPPAQPGVWLQSYHPLTTMVDPQGLRALPGSSPLNWFSGWAFASPDGRPVKETARDLLNQLCEYTLHLDAFEQLAPGPRADRNGQRDGQRRREDLDGNQSGSRCVDRLRTAVAISTATSTANRPQASHRAPTRTWKTVVSLSGAMSAARTCPQVGARWGSQTM